jgi:hypothetical protein
MGKKGFYDLTIGELQNIANEAPPDCEKGCSQCGHYKLPENPSLSDYVNLYEAIYCNNLCQCSEDEYRCIKCYDGPEPNDE